MVGCQPLGDLRYVYIRPYSRAFLAELFDSPFRLLGTLDEYPRMQLQECVTIHVTTRRVDFRTITCT